MLNTMPKQLPLISQINRTCGQMEGLGRQIQAKKDCSGIINQFLAVKAGLNRIGVLILKHEFSNCSLKDSKRMEKLISNLFKIN